MRLTTSLVAASACLPFLLLSSQAFAAEPASADASAAPASPAALAKAPSESARAESPAPSYAGLKGVELMLRPSFGAAPSDSPVRFQAQPNVQVVGDPGALLAGAQPWGGGFVGQASLGYRFSPFVSGGLRAGLRTSSASNVSDGSQNLSRSGWDAGFYVRVYPLAKMDSVSARFDPWLGVGVGYMHDSQTFKRGIAAAGRTVQADVELEHHAVAVPLGIGVDYRVARFFSVGPSFEYTIASAVAGCAKTSAAGFQSTSYCSTGDSAGDKSIKANSYGVWSLGLDAKLTF